MVSDPGSPALSDGDLAPSTSPGGGEEAERLVVGSEALRECGLEACLGPGPVVLEIGFGRGEVLIDLAANDPGRRHLGVEVSRKRVLKVARRVARARLENVRLVHTTAEYLLERVLAPASIDECWINCPDPWPKKRHHKRRLIRPDVLDRIAHVLRPGGLLHVATDHPGYTEWMVDAFARTRSLENRLAPEPFGRVRPARIESAYEAEFSALGHAVAYFEYRRPEVA